jgi:predicted phage terminase large subunit-like protein
MDSLLMRLMPPMKSPFTVFTPLKISSTEERAWKSVLYRAHDEDFSNLLWPQMYPEARLRLIRQDFAEQGMLDVYGQEYLNDPIDQTTAYFRKEDFLPMRPEDFTRYKTFYCAGDLAITENKRSAFTALGAGGMDSDGVLHLEDVRRGRWDSLQISDEIFSLASRFDPDTFRLESENIQRSIGPYLFKRMHDDGHYFNLDSRPPTKDKLARAQSIRARMRAGKVRFNKEADWYPDFEEELLHFPKWPYKDQVDMFAWMGLMLEEMIEGPTEEEFDEDLYEREMERDYSMDGVCATTGY